MAPSRKKRASTDASEELWKKAYRVFQGSFPEAPESEFWQYLYDTAEAYGVSATDELKNFLRMEHGDAATFNLQVDYVDTDSINAVGRELLADVARQAGFKCVDQSGSRAAFEYVPTRLVEFVTLMRKAALVHNITIKRTFFAFSSMGLTFNFPDEEVENQNSSIDTRQLEGDDLSEEEKLALCMRKGMLEEDAKTFLASFIEDKGSSAPSSKAKKAKKAKGK